VSAAGGGPLAVEVRAATRSYEADGVVVEALRGIDLIVPRGEFLAVMGPSGSGKSTLLHLMGALDSPTSGEVLVEGRALSSLSRRQLADVRGRRVGFVFQAFNLVPGLTVTENVALPAVLARQDASSYGPRVDALLDAVGLNDLADRYPSRLSGGQQQRVAIARGLVMEPAVLLADEPTGNLDSKSGREVQALFERCHEQGQTIVLVTHDVKVASRAERVISLRDGRIVDELHPRRSGPRALSRLIDLSDPEAV
jgi:putative ABC transport system ATP-binding protein